MSIKGFVALSIIAASILLVPIRSGDAAEVTGDCWSEYWRGDSYENQALARANISKTVLITSPYGEYWAKIALVVDVFQYQGDFDMDVVNFRVALYFDSFASPGWIPESAEFVTFFVDKDPEGVSSDNQEIRWDTSGTPGFSQSAYLIQGTNTQSDEGQRAFWALDALAFAVGLFLEPVDIAWDMITLASACIPGAGSDCVDADFDDVEARSYWMNPGYDFGDKNPVRQYALNSIRWKQRPVGPGNYYGIDVSARVGFWTMKLGLTYIDVGPVYLRIKKVVWPDVCDSTHTPGVKDGWVDLDDFMEVAKPANMFSERNPDGSWPNPPGDWGPHCDVNFDGRISVGDLMSIGVHLADPWPPPGYPYPKYVTQSALGTENSVNLFIQGNSPLQYTSLAETDALNCAQSEASSANPLKPQITIDPAVIVATPGKTFQVSAKVSNAINLYGWELSLSFNASVLRAVSVTQGPFLTAAGSTSWLTPRVNNTSGVITAGAMLWPYPPQGANDNGTLATVTFEVQSVGVTCLSFRHSELNTVIEGDTVPKNHGSTCGYAATTIQAAVDLAQVGDTIYVTEGTYHECIVINKSLTLKGESAQATIIDGGGVGDVIYINANNTEITQFSIINGINGIRLLDSYYNSIIGNTIANNQGGIQTKTSSNNTICNNNFINNIEFQASCPKSVNQWDNGSSGNYWSDYTGQDDNGDGIGDEPYKINKNNKDNCPLMQPLGPI